jgi:hypothetical protein
VPVVKLINIGKGDRRTLLDAAIVESDRAGDSTCRIVRQRRSDCWSN